MTQDDALRMMLGPFKAWRDVPGNEDVVKELTKIINAVEKILAQPEQEPVAKYSDIVSDGGFDPRNKFDVQPQRTWVGLTDEDIGDAYVAWDDTNGASFADFARAIEAKLKQKNGYAEEKNT